MLRPLRFFLVLVGAMVITPAAAEPCENDFAVLDANFIGARMSACKAKKKKFIIEISPENEPINPSPWYSFRVTPKQPGQLSVQINYKGAKHRYRPKRSADAQRWQLIDADHVREYRKGKRLSLDLNMDAEPFIVSAQELLLSEAYNNWIADIAERTDLSTHKIGESVEGRPLMALKSTPDAESGKKEYVLFVGRQHPPEVTGALAMLPFLETVFADTDLANAFRARFNIIAVPLMNPDGVDNGHWRHNMNGVDLNRDWGPFTQPETQSIKRMLDEIAEDDNSTFRLLFDFHSTQRNVFYTQFKDVETNPPKFTAKWLEGARERLKGYEFERAERETTDLATSKNYVNRRFGAPAITYELGDQTDRAQIITSAKVFAEEMMETLLSYDEE